LFVCGHTVGAEIDGQGCDEIDGQNAVFAEKSKNGFLFHHNEKNTKMPK